jgi:hypothetical protein
VHDAILEILNAGGRGKLRCCSDDAGRFFVRNARLLAIGAGREGLPRGDAFWPERVQQRERTAERGFPIATADLQKDDPRDAPAIGVARCIDFQNDPLLPSIELQSPIGRAAFRVPQDRKKLERACAVAERIIDRAVIE